MASGFRGAFPIGDMRQPPVSEGIVADGEFVRRQAPQVSALTTATWGPSGRVSRPMTSSTALRAGASWRSFPWRRGGARVGIGRGRVTKWPGCDGPTIEAASQASERANDAGQGGAGVRQRDGLGGRARLLQVWQQRPRLAELRQQWWVDLPGLSEVRP